MASAVTRLQVTVHSTAVNGTAIAIADVPADGSVNKTFVYKQQV